MKRSEERLLVVFEIISLVLLGIVSFGIQITNEKINDYHLDIFYREVDLIGIENELIHDSLQKISLDIEELKGESGVDNLGRGKEHYVQQWQRYKEIFIDKQTQMFDLFEKKPKCFGIDCGVLKGNLYLTQIFLLILSLAILVRINIGLNKRR